MIDVFQHICNFPVLSRFIFIQFRIITSFVNNIDDLEHYFLREVFYQLMSNSLESIPVFVKN